MSCDTKGADSLDTGVLRDVLLIIVVDMLPTALSYRELTLKPFPLQREGFLRLYAIRINRTHLNIPHLFFECEDIR